MTTPTWDPEAEAEMAKVPFFVRAVARRAVMRAAAAEGVRRIDLALVQRVRAESRERRGAREAQG